MFYQLMTTPKTERDGDHLVRRAAQIEAELGMGRGAASLAGGLPEDHSLPASLAFAVGRAAEEDEDFVRARRLFELAVRTGDLQLRSRATAHLAHLDYYAGAFAAGLERAVQAIVGSIGIARVEAELYASVNAIALNRSGLSLEHALAANNGLRRISDPLLRRDARFRVARQLVHVLAARGDYAGAWNHAEGARRSAALVRSERQRALSQYLCGYVAFARGDAICLAYFQDAARTYGSEHAPFGRWLEYIWAIALRDFGDPQRACMLWKRSGIELAWEDPLFQLSCGESAALVDPAPRPDERPFRAAMRGVQLSLSGDFSSAVAILEAAVAEFERCELEHFRRGAALALAATLVRAGEVTRATGILRAETPTLAKSNARCWPWSHPRLTRDLAAAALATQLAPAYWRSFLSPRPPALPDDVMRARGLTEREISVFVAWLAQPDLTRAGLAAALGVAESSVRNHINSARRKLGCGVARGPIAVERRLKELGQSIALR